MIVEYCIFRIWFTIVHVPIPLTMERSISRCILDAGEQIGLYSYVLDAVRGVHGLGVYARDLYIQWVFLEATPRPVDKYSHAKEQRAFPRRAGFHCRMACIHE